MSLTPVQIKKTMRFLSALELICISAILMVAFGFQFFLDELPCPLCLLQRIGLLAIGFGFLLNIRYGIRPAHYSLSLLAAVFTGFISMRQVLLHIEPSSGGYGAAIWGLHMYTWVFVLAVLAIIYLSIALSFAKQYHPAIKEDKPHEAKTPWLKTLGHIAFALFLFLVIVNVVSTFIECGWHTCPDTPRDYAVF